MYKQNIRTHTKLIYDKLNEHLGIMCALGCSAGNIVKCLNGTKYLRSY